MIDAGTLIALRYAATQQNLRLHEDDALNTGVVTVAAEVLEELVEAYENRITEDQLDDIKHDCFLDGYAEGHNEAVEDGA